MDQRIVAEERWEVIRPGLAKLVAPAGPWLQVFDAAGFEWNKYRIALHNLPAGLEGLRIVHLADLHCRKNWMSGYDDLLARIAADPPDLILFTGDAVEHKHDPGIGLPTARRIARGLKARLGVYGIRGNHDQKISASSFDGTPLTLIDGQRILLGDPNAEIEIIAVPGPEREDLPSDFAASIPAKRAGVPRVMLSHYPDHIRRLEGLSPDIYLAGHTHGGQVCFPGGLPVIRHDSLPWELCKGVHRWAHSWFVVSRGFGFSSLPIRVLCPAEVVEIQLERG